MTQADFIVVGAGLAGSEAALVLANCGKTTGTPPRIAAPGANDERSLKKSRSESFAGIHDATCAP